MQFATQTVEAAPENSRLLLEKSLKTWRMIPNLHAAMDGLGLVSSYAEFSRHIELVAIFDSSPEKLQRHIAKHEAPFPVLADESNQYYKAYRVERSLAGVLRGMIFRFPTLIKSMFMGNFPTTIRGSMTTMPADFLIDGNGVIVKAYYGKDEGDHLPVSEIIEFAKRSASNATTGPSSFSSTQS